MPVEIERKFLVRNDNWKDNVVSSSHLSQGYLSIDKFRTIRVRTAGQKGFITIKGIRNGFSRPEYEYEIPYNDALEMLGSLCLKPIIEKVRYNVLHNNLHWEVDVFENESAGLIIAELEFDSEDTIVDLPDWVGEDVTSDSRYSNSNLVKYPFSLWENKSI